MAAVVEPVRCRQNLVLRREQIPELLRRQRFIR